MSKKKQEQQIYITAAAHKDGFCNYSFEITAGVGAGDTHNVKGKGLTMPDLDDAFAALNVHLACIDDAFKNAGIEVTDIDAMVSDERTTDYIVSSVKITGSKEDRMIVLSGTKRISCSHGRMDITTPKIPIDGGTSSYTWYNELQTAIDQLVAEVKLYKDGKYTLAEPDEEAEDPNQIDMFDGVKDAVKKFRKATKGLNVTIVRSDENNKED